MLGQLDRRDTCYSLAMINIITAAEAVEAARSGALPGREAASIAEVMTSVARLLTQERRAAVVRWLHSPISRDCDARCPERSLATLPVTFPVLWRKRHKALYINRSDSPLFQPL
jgi:hypothetical protein